MKAAFRAAARARSSDGAGRVALLGGEEGPGQVGPVGVALHLSQSDRRIGQAAVGEADGVVGVLPALVAQAPVGGALVLDVAVAVAVAELLDPFDGPVGVREQLVDGLAGQAPPAQLPEQHHEQRGGVGGAVVDGATAERERRRLAEAHLVQDAARLLLVVGPDVLALEAGQRLQGAEGQLGVDQQRHPGGQQRVAAEQGHEPRGAGGHHRPLRVVGVEDPQGPEVLGAAGHHGPQALVVGVEDRHAAPPGRHALGRLGPRDGLAAQPAGLDLVVVDAAGELLAQRPRPLGLDDDLPAGGVAVEHGRPGEGDPQAAPVGAVLVAEHQRPVARRRTSRSPLPVDPGLLDREEVGEVGAVDHLDGAVGRLLAEVADHQVLAHAPPDVAAPLDHEVGIGPARAGPGPGHEGGRVGIGARRGPGLRGAGR